MLKYIFNQFVPLLWFSFFIPCCRVYINAWRYFLSYIVINLFVPLLFFIPCCRVYINAWRYFLCYMVINLFVPLLFFIPCCRVYINAWRYFLSYIVTLTLGSFTETQIQRKLNNCKLIYFVYDLHFRSKLLCEMINFLSRKKILCIYSSESVDNFYST